MTNTTYALTSPCGFISMTFTPSTGGVTISTTGGSTSVVVEVVISTTTDVVIPTENARDLYRALRAEGWMTAAENAEGEAMVEEDLATEAAAAREPYSNRESEADCREYDAQRA
jgi:hypothetical protein